MIAVLSHFCCIAAVHCACSSFRACLLRTLLTKLIGNTARVVGSLVLWLRTESASTKRPEKDLLIASAQSNIRMFRGFRARPRGA
jgi:sensor domain CHASE-containing protein